MNQQPKTSYQDFLKDIYSAMKKINQTTGDIFTKLETLDMRISNLEKNYLSLSGDIKKIINNSSSEYDISPSKQSGSSKLLSLLTQLNESVNDVSDSGMNVYTLGTNTTLEAIYNNPKPNPKPNHKHNSESNSESNLNSNTKQFNTENNEFESQYDIDNNYGMPLNYAISNEKKIELGYDNNFMILE